VLNGTDSVLVRTGETSPTSCARVRAPEHRVLGQVVDELDANIHDLGDAPARAAHPAGSSSAAEGG
jgi:hypothetical protein